MSNIRRWSKEANLDEITYESLDGSIPLSRAIRYMKSLAEDVASSAEILRQEDDRNKFMRAFDFWIEPWYEEFGVHHDLSFDELYKQLKKLTDEGYDMRSEWRLFRDSLEVIWKSLPTYYEGLNKAEGENNFLPKDYDPEKPFPQYPIPEDIEE